jgi:hypothetical protein
MYGNDIRAWSFSTFGKCGELYAHTDPAIRRYEAEFREESRMRCLVRFDGPQCRYGALNKWIPFKPFGKLRRAFDMLTTNETNILPFVLN